MAAEESSRDLPFSWIQQKGCQRSKSQKSYHNFLKMWGRKDHGLVQLEMCITRDKSLNAFIFSKWNQP